MLPRPCLLPGPRALAIVAVLAPWAGVAAAQQPVQMVTQDHAACMRDNADRYLAKGRPIYLISPAGCLEGLDLADETTASTATPFAAIRQGAADGVSGDGGTAEREAVIVLVTPGQLVCLRDGFDEVARPVSDGDGTMVELHFDGC